MVEKFKKILAELQKEYTVSLFVVLKLDDFIDKWSVIVCGESIKPSDKESFKEIVKIFNTELSDEEISSIARLGIFNEQDYIPQLFANYKEGTEILKETQINGFTIHEGYILLSNLEAKKTESSL